MAREEVWYPVPYTNCYIVNRGVVAPALGGLEGEEELKRRAEILPDR